MLQNYTKTIILSLFLIFSILSAQEVKPKVDCTLVTNQFNVYLRDFIKQIQKEEVPENSCGAAFVIEVAHNDKELRENENREILWDNDIDLRNYGFEFGKIKDHLNKTFLHYNMNRSLVEKTQKMSYFLQIAAWQKEIVAPGREEDIAKRFSKMDFNSNIDSFGVGEDSSTPTQCNMFVSSSLRWIISEPQNDLRGWVKVIEDNGEKKPLKKGRLRFTRLGPNNGAQTQFDADIEQGLYVTEPKLPSGHYKIELLEPTSCKKVLEENWVFSSGSDMVKNFEIKCESCNWDVKVKGDYTVCSEMGGCKEASGTAIWKSLPIAIDEEKQCHNEVPKLQVLHESPFDMVVLNPEIKAILTGDFLANEQFFLNIAKIVPKQNASIPKFMKINDEPIIIDFNTQSKTLEKLEDKDESIMDMRDEFSIGATHQCFMASQGFMKWGDCKISNIKDKLTQREEFSFSIDEKDPFGSGESSHFEFTFVPTN